MILAPSVLEAQSLQWSTYTGQTNAGSTHSSANWCIKKGSDGALFVLGATNIGTLTAPNFPTTDIKVFGTLGVNSGHITLSKYSADGSQLLWVRIFAATSATRPDPYDLGIGPNDEPYILMTVNGEYPLAITPDAWQPNPPSFAASGKSLLLVKLNNTGTTVNYGTYIGSTGGSIGITNNTGNPLGSTFTDPMKVGTDGSVYLGFNTTTAAGQTGTIPTTVDAFRTGHATDLSGSCNIMIFNPNNTLRYSTYIGGSTTNSPVWETLLVPNGDFYVSLGIAVNTATNLMPSLAGGAFPTNHNNGALLRINPSNQITGTYNVSGRGLARKSNGNIVSVPSRSSIIREFSADLSTLTDSVPCYYTPVTDRQQGEITHAEFDPSGRLHITVNGYESSTPKLPPITQGALQASLKDRAASYAIFDTDYKTLLYSTLISDQTVGFNGSPDFTMIRNFVLDGCNAILAGKISVNSGVLSFPVTPSAWNNAGTAQVTGYDLTPTNVSGSTGTSSFLMKFNVPVLSNTNTLTTTETNYCLGAGAFAIDGNAVKYKTPNVLGIAESNPAPFPLHYQWERSATSATGPWAVVANSDKEDYTPSESVAGSYWYRRAVRQTRFDALADMSSCDPTYYSNVIQYDFSANIVHKTDVLEDSYGLCAGSSLPITVNITPSPDAGARTYTYKVNYLGDSTVAVQTGSVTGTSFSLTINQAIDYWVRVTDDRGCTSYDTLYVKKMTLDAGTDIQLTCGSPTVKLGTIAFLPTYINFPTPSVAWSSTTGLDNPLSIKPVFTHGLAVGDSITKYLSFNGCPNVDSIKVMNTIVTPLVPLPDRAICQGDTVTMGLGLVAQTGVTYEWAPGLGLTSTSALRPIMTSLYAPQGVNERLYYLKAQNGTSGCIQYDSQKVTVYRYPNQSFQVKDCMDNGCDLSKPISYGTIGNPSEVGISYSWSVVILPQTATTGVPTPTEALAAIQNPTSSTTTIQFATPSAGRADASYTIQFIRTSFNPANPTCMRTDTAFLYYCICGQGTMCALGLGALPTVACGSPNNLIGPVQPSTGGTYTWSRVDGAPLDGLFDPITKIALTDGGPHGNQAIADPTGLVAVNYKLTLIKAGSDTCAIDIRVFPSAVGKPNINYTTPQASCQGTPYTLVGPAANPGLQYAWSPSASLNDTTLALPTVVGLTTNTPFYVTVTDATTACSVIDTVLVVPTLSDVDAGTNTTYCGASGATVSIGSPAKAGYTYQWSTITSGVTFGSATSSATTATIPANAGTVTLYLDATNITTAQNCVLRDSIVFTSAGNPTIPSIPTSSRFCTGGVITLGPVTPSGYDYSWSGPGIVGATNTQSVQANAAGTYTVTVTQGSCTATKTVAITAVNPTVTAGPFTAPCASPKTLAVTNINNTATGIGFGTWAFSWSPLTDVVTSNTDMSSISVYPTVATTYTLTATSVAGCTQTYTFAIPAATYKADLPSTINFCEGNGVAQLPLNTLPVDGTVVWTASPTTATSYLNSTTANQPTIDMTTIPAGTYTFTATVSYPTGCSSVATTTVTIGKKVADMAGIDKTICATTTTTIGTTQTGYSFEWSASPYDSTLLSIYLPQPSVAPKVPTTYKAQYMNASGCVFTDSVVVNPSYITPELTLVGDTICQNSTGTATFDLATTIATNTGATTTYWNNASATIATINPTSISGTHYIKTVSADGNCAVTKSVVIGFNDLPNFNINGDFNCTSKTGTITLSSYSAGAKVDYTEGVTYTGSATYATAATVPSSGIIANNIAVPTVSQRTFTVRVFNSADCYTDKTVTISSINCCGIDIMVSDTTICSGTTINLFSKVNQSSAILTYSTDGVSYTTLADPTNITPTVSTTYYIRDSLSATCLDIDTLVITVNPQPTTPAVSSPIMNICPLTTVDLTTISSALTPSVSGGVFEWHVSNSSSSALVSNQNTVVAGDYYLFERSPAGCYSIGLKVTVAIQVCCPPKLCIPVTVTRN